MGSVINGGFVIGCETDDSMILLSSKDDKRCIFPTSEDASEIIGRLRNTVLRDLPRFPRLFGVVSRFVTPDDMEISINGEWVKAMPVMYIDALKEEDLKCA